MTERAPRPRVSSPIIFRPFRAAAERVVRPCSAKHRHYWLTGYIVSSCTKCTKTIEVFHPESEGSGS